MTVKEIRDKLVEQRTVRQSAIKESEKLCKEIKELLASIDEESMEVLTSYGFDLTKVKGIDVDRLKEDKEYKAVVQLELESVCERLHEFLEEQLG